MIVRELITRLGYDLKDAPFKKYAAQVDSFKKGAVAVAAIATAASAAVFGVVKSAANYGDDLLNTSQKLGIAVDSLQRLRFAAKLANVGNEELAVSLRFLSKNIDDARTGSKEAAKAFQRLGIDPKTAKVNEDLIARLSKGFIKLKDPTAQVALAQQLLGRSGANLLPLLKEGPEALKKYFEEAGRFGLVTQEDAELADQFNDNLERLSMGVGMLKNRIGLALIPKMGKALEVFLKWYDLNRRIIEQNVGKAFNFVADVLRRVWRIGRAAFDAIERLVEAFGGIERTAKVFGPIAVALAVMLGAINPVTVAVVALSAAVGLLADDFLSFRDGQKHLLPWPAIIDKITTSVQFMRDAWTGLNIVAVAFKDTLDQILKPFQVIADLAGKFGRFHLRLFGKMFGIENIEGKLQGANEGFSSAVVGAAKSLPGPNDALLAPIKALAEIGREARNADNPVLPIQASPSPGGIGGAPVANNQTNRFAITQNVNVNVDGGGDPEEIAARVKDTVRDETRKTWNALMRNLQPGTAN